MKSLLIALFILLPFHTVAQQLEKRAGPLERIFVTTSIQGGILPASNVKDPETKPASRFTGFGYAEGIGLRLPWGFSVTGAYSRTMTKGKIDLIKVPSAFAAGVNSNPDLAGIPVTIPSAPRADLTLVMRSWKGVVDKRISIGKFKFLVGGGPMRTCVDNSTDAKSGIPSDITFDDEGMATVVTGGLHDRGTECHWTDYLHAGVPIGLGRFEIIPEYSHEAGRHQVGVSLMYYPFRRKKVVY